MLNKVFLFLFLFLFSFHVSSQCVAAFKFLVKPNFRYENVKKPMSKKFKGKKQYLKKFTEDEKILSRKLHNA